MLNYTKKIKSIMALYGLTQMEISKKMGMSVSNFNKKLTRKNKAKFTIDEAMCLAKILERTLDEVFLKDIA